MDAGQLRNHVRERLTDAWSTGELEKAVQEARESSPPAWNLKLLVPLS